ncbi:hypothetical protein [Helicobacter suis]|uniref:hypothetical protein n=1 Tax=Helicobacter suis TaxID=104628 RepID=UPI00131587EB|nr:hypothetical protein [Helicobacter suis]
MEFAREAGVSLSVVFSLAKLAIGSGLILKRGVFSWVGFSLEGLILGGGFVGALAGSFS